MGRPTATKYVDELLSYEWPPIAHALESQILGKGKSLREPFSPIISQSNVNLIIIQFLDLTSAELGKGLEKKSSLQKAQHQMLAATIHITIQRIGRWIVAAMYLMLGCKSRERRAIYY